MTNLTLLGGLKSTGTRAPGLWRWADGPVCLPVHIPTAHTTVSPA